jgi:hypothetical protein
MREKSRFLGQTPPFGMTIGSFSAACRVCRKRPEGFFAQNDEIIDPDVEGIRSGSESVVSAARETLRYANHKCRSEFIVYIERGKLGTS